MYLILTHNMEIPVRRDWKLNQKLPLFSWACNYISSAMKRLVPGTNFSVISRNRIASCSIKLSLNEYKLKSSMSVSFSDDIPFFLCPLKQHYCHFHKTWKFALHQHSSTKYVQNYNDCSIKMAPWNLKQYWRSLYVMVCTYLSVYGVIDCGKDIWTLSDLFRVVYV